MPSKNERVATAKPALNGHNYSDDDDETEGLLAATATQYGYPPINSTYNSVQDGSEENDPIEIEINNPMSEEAPTQNSIITIFSMWNTMMGTSLLSMPWAIKQAGFVNGIILLIVMAGIMAYTCYRVLNSGRKIVGEVVSDFTDAVRIYLGKISEAVALLCSLLALLGGAIVYWILMSNFLYHVVMFIYHHVHHSDSTHNGTSGNLSFSYGSDVNPAVLNVVCGNTSETSLGQSKLFKTLWNETLTVPLYLIVLLFPLFNFKSPTFFTKFNAFEFSWTFPALTGVAALAYFLQNAVMAIVKNQKHPENNARDLIIAYVLVCFTYTFMGAMFYASFPLDKSCIEDNLLNNLASQDVMAFVARCCLFFQMTCVLPLLLYVFRAQLLHFLFGRIWPGKLHVLILNFVVVAICVFFAIFLPNIGHIISFVGAFCGFSYAIAFPCSVYMLMCYKEGSLSWIKVIFHGFLITLGLANFIGQFIIIGHTT